MRRTNRKETKPVQLRKQREVIREDCRGILPAIAQLRHMRKPRFGAYEVVKRCRTVNKAMRAEGFGTVWEYSVLQERRVPVRRVRSRRRRARMALRAVSC